MKKINKGISNSAHGPIEWSRPLTGVAPQLDYSKAPELNVCLYSKKSGDLIFSWSSFLTVEQCAEIKDSACASDLSAVIYHVESESEILKFYNPIN